MGGEDLQDKEDAISGIRDDDIGKDGVGMAAAGTDDAHDRHLLPDNGAVLKNTDLSPVIGMDTAVAFGGAVRTGVQLWPVTVHEGLE